MRLLNNIMASVKRLAARWPGFFAKVGRRRLLGACIAVIPCLLVVDLLLPPPLAKGAETSVIVVDREGRWLHAFATNEGRWRFRADLDQIDAAFVERLIAIEDKRFYDHLGVDFLAVGRAAWSFASSGRITSGASTITMQTARLLEPRPRTLPSKLIEMLRAVQIERRLSKGEILSLYLTLAPYGGNIEGVRAASLLYFDREPRTLTPGEQALLIALPQAPEARRPDRHPEVAKAARQTIMARLAANGLLSAAQVTEHEGVTAHYPRQSFPRYAYHSAHRLAKHPNEGRIESSLDLDKQAVVETVLTEHMRQSDDGATAAAIVLDGRSGEVLASVGAASLLDPGGWIDLTRAVRSPGSLLKPFIYGMALEDGIASSESILSDAPRSFGTYRPENFDRAFRGDVRLREALQHSLNVPAVATLEKIGAPRFAAKLQAAGASLRKPRRSINRDGLATALGGVGIRLVDVAMLYTSLSNDGLVSPVKWRPLGGGAVDGVGGLKKIPDETPERENPGEAKRLLSKDAARRVSAILTGSPSLAGRAPAALSAGAPIIAYKTGTSYGYRDAWAAGHANGVVIAVWVGRADGAPRPRKTGRKTAAPLLFKLFDALSEDDAHLRSLAAQPHNPDGAPLFDEAGRTRAAGPLKPLTITFPFPQTELFVDRFGEAGRGVRLSASGGEGLLRWYDSGVEIKPSESGRILWRPREPGFYTLTVVDEEGRSAKTAFRVKGPV